MESNLNLGISFKGQQKLNATAVPMQEGYLKLGGIIDSTLSAAVAFGLVMSAAPATSDVFTPGVPSGNIIRGISVYDDAIAQNAPAHPNGYLPGLPASVISNGLLWLGSWNTTATGAIDPVIGCQVIYNTTTGEIQFLASGASAPSGWSAMSNASVKTVDSTLGALVYLA